MDSECQETLNLNGIANPNHVTPRQKAQRKRQILASIIAALGPLQAGFVLGYSSPTILQLEKQGYLDRYTTTWFASIATLGALVGAPIGGLFLSLLGRKGTMIACGPIFVTSWLIIISAGLDISYPLLLTGRFFSGAALGLVCVVVPIYITEITTPDMRGTLGSLFLVALGTGSLLPFLLNLIPVNWQWLAVTAAALAVLMTVLLMLVPESPLYLAAKHQNNKAWNSLRWLRGDSYDIEGEFREIVEYLSMAPSTNICSSNLHWKPILKPLGLTLGLMIFQQASGLNAVLFYAEPIFESANFQGNPSIPAAVLGFAQVVASITSVFFIDKLGRKTLLCISGSLMSLGLIVLGLCFYFQSNRSMQGLGWLAILSSAVFVAAFSIGWGPLPWTIMSELIASKGKGPATGLAVIANWACAFIVTKEFDDMLTVFKPYGAYWFFAAVNALGVLYVATKIPETNGKSLEQIDRLFSEKSATSFSNNSSSY